MKINWKKIWKQYAKWLLDGAYIREEVEKRQEIQRLVEIETRRLLDRATKAEAEAKQPRDSSVWAADKLAKLTVDMEENLDDNGTVRYWLATVRCVKEALLHGLR